jgi:negative regulator of sigma E activity
MTRADDIALAQALSAVMDGQATTADWALVNAAWDADPALRERWALWHAAADGLRSAELPAVHRDPLPLLDALHARLPAPVVALPRRRREWLAPLAVAAGFVAMAVGLGTLRPPAAPEALVAAAPNTTPRVQGLVGMSFAQAAAGRTLPAVGAPRDTGWLDPAAPESIDWGAALPDAAASRPGS